MYVTNEIKLSRGMEGEKTPFLEKQRDPHSGMVPLYKSKIIGSHDKVLGRTYSCPRGLFLKSFRGPVTLTQILLGV